MSHSGIQIILFKGKKLREIFRGKLIQRAVVEILKSYEHVTTQTKAETVFPCYHTQVGITH